MANVVPEPVVRQQSSPLEGDGFELEVPRQRRHPTPPGPDHLQPPDAAPVDLAIATGLSKRAVAERFGVWGHAQAHLTAEMRAALATKLLQREADTRRSALSLDAKFRS